MRRREVVLLLSVVIPPLFLAVAGIFHPMGLSSSTGHTWRELHLVLLPVFPLLGLAPYLVVLREPIPVRVVIGILGFVYAVYYTALDVLSGIGAGSLQLAGMRPSASVLFHTGNQLAEYGVWAYLLAAALACALTARRAGLAAVPCSVLVIGGAISFLDSHIYWPRGVITMLVLAAGWGWLLLVRQRLSSGAAAS